MNFDLHKYWKAVRANETQLGSAEYIYIVSKENEAAGTVGGVISVASREYAARWIANGTHERASDAQAAAYEDDLARRTADIERTELAKKQTVRLETAIPQDQLRSAIADALADQANNAKPKHFTQKDK
jgi:hypothetical protein